MGLPDELNGQQPPSYVDTLDPPDLELDGLPGYSDTQQSPLASISPADLNLKEFEYKIEKNGKTSATLTLIAHESISKTVPTFKEGFPIKGRIYLNLSNENLEYVKSIVIKVSSQKISLIYAYN